MKLSSSVFWISRPKKRGQRLSGREGASSSEQQDDVLLRVSKLIPAEIVGVYLSGRHIAEINGAIGSWAILCLLLSLIFRTLTTRDPHKVWTHKSVQWDAVFYAGVSFCIWVYAMGDNIGGILLGEYQFWASLLAIAWPVVAAQLIVLPKRD